MGKIAILICFVAISYFCYYWAQNMEDGQTNENIVATPTFIAGNIETSFFNVKGELYQVLGAKRAEHYKSIELTELDEPSLVYYPQNDTSQKKLSQNSKIEKNEIWYISSDEGTLNNNDNFVLRGHVLAKNSNVDSFVNEIKSNYLELDLNTNELRTPEKINIKGLNLENSGTGFYGNITTKYFKINKDCHAQYSGFVKK